ncbi:MAG: hypothetical protein AAGF92_18195 [Myxococcota bacterium]
MNIPLRRTLTASLASLVVLSSCAGTKTSIPISWRNPGYESAVFDDLLVIGVGRNEGSRRLFEDEFAKKLSAEGARAQASWELLPDTTQLTQEQIANAVQAGSFDAVLITRLLSVDKEQEYVEGSTYSVPGNYYGSAYYGYYATSYAVVHEPGYFKTNTTFRLETNLYAVSDSGLVWSGQSDTVNPSSVADVIDSMTTAVANTLRQQRLIP